MDNKETRKCAQWRADVFQRGKSHSVCPSCIFLSTKFHANLFRTLLRYMYFLQTETRHTYAPLHHTPSLLSDWREKLIYGSIVLPTPV